MIHVLTRMFRVKVAPRPRTGRSASLRDLARIRRQLERSIEDCPSESAQRLRQMIHEARTPLELWLLRNDAYQLISQRHDQTIAARRINALIHCFEGWLEPKQLVPIK
ncbi:hypothetical protein [Hydrogenophaga sp. BPS33]|uniref:hypothetical protein n=1 Tax=Hydrogenophaga sp. BPS33 TaxID=2651974 RepID=UPI00131FA1C6|nr:hypothetical protein [Hydrogenophaga sp. BPS33]QHE87678.1 hypothetical protein F9K07_23660 [Hydrogenophaga sp. BPS33]